jgi:hypothetical protein
MTDGQQSGAAAAGRVRLRRAKVFISYRRDDTSGEAGHLAADLRKQLGRVNVFIDIDTIAPRGGFRVPD